MTPFLQKYYEDRLSMTGGQGWKDLMEDLDVMIKATDSLSSVTADKSLDFRKGELSIMFWLKSLRDISSQAYEELQNEDK